MSAAFYEDLLAHPVCRRIPLPADELPAALDAGFKNARHGDLPRWLAAIERLPELPGRTAELGVRAVTARASSCPAVLGEALRVLVPWRKGPFDLHGVAIDSEWQSWMKWDRLARAVDFNGATVLDIGSGNGYYGWRMLGAGAKAVVGVDPTPLYVAQFHAVARLLPPLPNWVLPLRAEQLVGDADFDIVLSMGVLYHQRGPLGHLADLRRWARRGGQVVIETIVVPGDDTTVLTPRDRYAQMRNVWFIPSTAALVRWFERVGFVEIEVIDESITDLDEQRATDWMPFHSLADFLAPGDAARTVEGYPRPRRAIVSGHAA
ncbi:MAG: tRNA 5-methoxyuridine(34)/uridine 5-oxyacetic acid(34) synthase CmoB [Pseudomonadota bacterium]